MKKNQNISPKLSIIIVSFNTKAITRNCIKSIYEAEWQDPFEVIVVDNGSVDGSTEMIREEFPTVKLIVNQENKFFSIANNQGAKIAEGKYLLLLNSDTLVSGNNLQKMIDFFETCSENVICIGPKILNKDGSLQSCGEPLIDKPFIHFCSLFRLDKFLPVHLLNETLYRKADRTHRTDWVSGCCMMIPRDLYLMVGGLNEKLLFYGEEPEFGYRTEKLGYRTLYFADAEIIHLGGQSSKTGFAKKYSFKKDMQEYERLVVETYGFEKAIKVSKRILISNRIKLLFYKDKQYVRNQISHDCQVIEYFKNKIKEKKD